MRVQMLACRRFDAEMPPAQQAREELPQLPWLPAVPPSLPGAPLHLRRGRGAAGTLCPTYLLLRDLLLALQEIAEGAGVAGCQVG